MAVHPAACCHVQGLPKRALIERLTADAIEITRIPASEFFVLINELEQESIGRSGRTCADIMAEMK